MKKLTVFVIFFMAIGSMCFVCSAQKAVAIQNQEQFIIKTNNNIYTFDSAENCISFTQNNYSSMPKEEKFIVAQKMLKMGFDKETIIDYLFPSIKNAISKIENNENVLPQDACVVAVENCKIQFKNGKNGLVFDKNQLYNAFFDDFLNNQMYSAQFKIVPFEKGIADIKPLFAKCSDFSTNYASSGAARKNNIELAAKSINGIILKQGDELSFNKATGPRNASNGYMSAKIIVGGDYVEGFGGGVCQVSTTLYNAALLAGLKIAEVHPHSLPSGYVEPGFDAMVNMGSSDLKIVNNSANDYLITASANAGVCRVAIYGIMPDFTIKKRYEKYDIAKHGTDRIKTEYVTDAAEVCLVRVSHGVDGYKVKTYIDYYDGDVLVKTEQIRDCKYNSKRGMVVEYKLAEQGQ